MSEVRALVSLGVLLLAGCGQRGELYLPEKNGEVVMRPTQTPPAEPAVPETESDQGKKTVGGTPKP